MKTFKDFIKENAECGKFMHCHISKQTDTKDHKNPMSGHQWTTETPQTSRYGSNNFYVTGGKLGQRKFNNIDRAKDAIKFDHDVQFGKFKQFSEEYYTESGYQGEHTAPNRESGAPLHDLTANGVYPHDVYSNKAIQYYGTGESGDRAIFNKLHSLKNKPEAMVDVYRAVPKSAPDTINHGDWVTIHRPYAKDHGEAHLDDYKILHEKHPAKRLYTNGDSPYEAGLDKRD